MAWSCNERFMKHSSNSSERMAIRVHIVSQSDRPSARHSQQQWTWRSCQRLRSDSFEFQAFGRRDDFPVSRTVEFSFAVSVLRKAAEILVEVNSEESLPRPVRLSPTRSGGSCRICCFTNIPRFGDVYAYEVDGFAQSPAYG